MANEIVENALQEINGVDGNWEQDDSLGLESLTLLVYTQKMRGVEEKVRDIYSDVKQTQNTVRFLHELLKMINNATDSKGNLDMRNNPDMQEMFARARELGVQLPEDKMQFTREEREHVVENLRVTCDDLNQQNEMKMQTIHRLTSEYDKVIYFAKDIMKRLNDDKVNKARAMAR